MKALVPVVHRAAAVRATLRRGLPRASHRVVGCRTAEQAARYLGDALVDAVVVDVQVPGAASTAFRLAQQFPRIPIFALSAFRPDDGALLAACRAAGLRGVLVEGVDEPIAAEFVAARTATAGRRQALADAPRRLRLTEPIQLDAWHEVLARAGAPMTTQTVAHALRRTREHLSREFGAGGAPNLKRVIDLVRAAWAADLLQNPGYTVREVARLLGYSSASHLTGSARRIAGCRAQELGTIGPRGVLQRFVRGRTRSRV